MSGDERRQAILYDIKRCQIPIPGQELARRYGVSRQVIVQDIAIIRATGYGILSTSQGYLPQVSESAAREFCVRHTDEQMEDELLTVVDLGGRVLDVSVTHEVYGRLQGPLNLRSRRDVALFMESIRLGKSRPMKNLTDDKHFHKIEADSDEILNLIEKELRKKGYLLVD